MILSKRSNGFYYIIYKQPNGKRTRISTKMKNKADALSFLSNFEKRVNERKSQKLSTVTFSEYAKRFIQQKKMFTTNKTIKAYQQSINYFTKYVGKTTLREISFQKLNEYFQLRKVESSIYQTRKDYICLNSLFNFALDEDILQSNPMRKVKPFKLPEKLPMYFTEEEFIKLYNKIDDPDIKDVVDFALNTGLRQMEILTLKWTEIHIRNENLVLSNREVLTKSKKVRSIPVTSKALEIINRRKLNAGCIEYVFSYKGKKITQDFIAHKFKKYVKATELNNKLNFHSLRHTFASWLVQKGVSIYEISKLLGHSDIKTTQIYAHLRSEDLRSAIDKLNN